MASVHSLEAPAIRVIAVTPADSALPLGICHAIWVGGAGNLAIRDASDNDVVFTGVPAGTLLKVMAKQIRSTSTTATSILALYS